MNLADFDPDVVVDADGCVLGRVASEVAERVQAGERVAVVNAEDAVVTGRKEEVIERYRKRVDIGSDQGPYQPRRPDGLLKRSIRGMLPMNRSSGREALANVRAYVGNPFEADPEVLEGTELDPSATIRFVTLGEISHQLGATQTW
ncbi:MAG: 50S ribosomal protein L13 [Halobacteriales archaeon]